MQSFKNYQKILFIKSYQYLKMFLNWLENRQFLQILKVLDNLETISAKID